MRTSSQSLLRKVCRRAPFRGLSSHTIAGLSAAPQEQQGIAMAAPLLVTTRRCVSSSSTTASVTGVSALAPGAAALATNPHSVISNTRDEGRSETTSMSILRYPYRVIDTEEALADAVGSLSTSEAFSFDIEAFCTQSEQRQLGTISLLQMCSTREPVVFLVDVVTLGVPLVVKHMGPLMKNPAIKKLMFDCRRDVEAVSVQMGLKIAGVQDLQLFFTALQWRAKSVNRRSGMTYVIKGACNIARQEGDSAVQAAMTLGNRAVWDVRPLPAHFLEYAADDVRHILMLSHALHKEYADMADGVVRLSSQYVDHYAVGLPVEVEADPKPHEVSVDWLERFIGPGGRCTHCGAKGHSDAECFRKQTNTMKCSHCGDLGHIAKNCYRKHPHLLKCELCGQMGHTRERCFQRNRCEHCGGQHRSDRCHKHLKETRRQEEDEERRQKAEAEAKKKAEASEAVAATTAQTLANNATATAATTESAEVKKDSSS